MIVERITCEKLKAYVNLELSGISASEMSKASRPNSAWGGKQQKRGRRQEVHSHR